MNERTLESIREKLVEDSKSMLDSHVAGVQIRKMLGENFMPSVKYTIVLGWFGILQRFKIKNDVSDEKAKKLTKVVSLLTQYFDLCIISNRFLIKR